MRNKIPLVDSFSFYKDYREDINSAIIEVLNSGIYILGEMVQKFEHLYSNYCGTQYCIGVGNGTDALIIALKALGVQDNDQVACVANAGFYSSTAILSIGANPLYIDVEYNKMTMCPKELEYNISHDTKAIIVTHLYGQMADIGAIIKVSKKMNIPVIEDCAQAHGAQINGKKAGSWGNIGCFSFYPTKNLGALGDAGAVVTSNQELAARLKKIRQYGWSDKYRIDQQIGVNSRMDEIQAAILITKLSYLDKMNQNRTKVANYYTSLIINSDILLPIGKEKEHVFHQYVIRHPKRDYLKEHLAKEEVQSEIHYPIPDYRQGVFKLMNNQQETYCKNTEAFCNSVLSLPINGITAASQVKTIAQIINDF